jgi:hypothetical protein
MKRVGKNVPKARSSRGGVPRGLSKRATCQNPIHVRHQKRTIGFGRKRRNNAQVTRTLKARAASLRSVQCVREVALLKRKPIGKTVGNPIEVNPLEVNGM